MPITKKYINDLTYQVIGCAIEVHKHLGPGLLESIYEKCFCYELEKRNISFARQMKVPIQYGDMFIEDGLRIDILVDDLLIVELKAQENYHPVVFSCRACCDSERNRAQ